MSEIPTYPNEVDSPQMLAVDDLEFLEAHDAIVYFSVGLKVGLEWRRPDGLKLQHSGWSVGHALNEARAALRKWQASERRGRGSGAGVSEARICPGCGKEPPRHGNYCTWECHVEATRKAGGREHLPNGLPVRCITADGMMLECEDDDHPDYKFPVEIGRERFVDRDDEERSNETHALIYTDGSIALTMYERCYALWSLRDGHFIGGPSWEVGKRLSTESIAKIRATSPGAGEDGGSDG